MFSNLGKGGVLHGVDKSGDTLKWFTATIERITPSINGGVSGNYPMPYGQLPQIDVDIVAIIDGKQREFKGIHGNDTIADFGKGAFILADSENALFNHFNSLLKTSENAVNEETIAWHNKMIPQYRDVLSQMRPGSTNNADVKALQKQVSTLQSQLAEALSLLKDKTPK